MAYSHRTLTKAQTGLDWSLMIFSNIEFLKLIEITFTKFEDMAAHYECLPVHFKCLPTSSTFKAETPVF